MNEARRTSPPDDDWNEPTDEHEEAAKAELAANLDALWDVLDNNAFRADHVAALFNHSADFRATVYRERDDWLKQRAQELADEEAHERDENQEVDQ